MPTNKLLFMMVAVAALGAQARAFELTDGGRSHTKREDVLGFAGRLTGHSDAVAKRLRERLLNGRAQIIDNGARAVFLGDSVTNQGMLTIDLTHGRVEELAQIPRTFAPAYDFRVTGDGERLISLVPEDTHHHRGVFAVTIRDFKTGELLGWHDYDWVRSVGQPQIQIDESAHEVSLVDVRKATASDGFIQRTRRVSLKTGALVAAPTEEAVSR